MKRQMTTTVQPAWKSGIFFKIMKFVLYVCPLHEIAKLVRVCGNRVFNRVPFAKSA